MISKEEVTHIAKLARLGLKNKEIKKFQKELSKILDYIEKLKEVDVTDIKPSTHPFGIQNVFRKDIFSPKKIEKIKDLLELAPAKKKGFLKVKKILK